MGSQRVQYDWVAYGAFLTSYLSQLSEIESLFQVGIGNCTGLAPPPTPDFSSRQWLLLRRDWLQTNLSFPGLCRSSFLPRGTKGSFHQLTFIGQRSYPRHSKLIILGFNCSDARFPVEQRFHTGRDKSRSVIPYPFLPLSLQSSL